jgi:hypothetical protein
VLGLFGAYTGYKLSHPEPDRFDPAVQTAGPALERALGAAPAQTYLSDFRFQQTGSTCGPASLRNVLTSFGDAIASERALFGDDRLSWWKALGTGMTLDELAALARANTSRQVEVLRPETLHEFQAALSGVNMPGSRLIVNFDRAPLFGVAVGHFSPVGGYDPATGLVTLLDVTEGYGFSLVPDRLLFDATRTIDPMAGRARGLLRIGDPARVSTRMSQPDHAGEQAFAMALRASYRSILVEGECRIGRRPVGSSMALPSAGCGRRRNVCPAARLSRMP